MERIIIVILALTTAGLLYGQLTTGPQVEAEASEEGEVEVSLDSVPANVIEAAIAAVEGIELTEAEVEAVLVYELEGTVDGREFEIEITAEGDVIEIEEDDESDEEDEPDDQGPQGGS